jgi:oxygen-independent coproporphyrinogen-3 oxidase
VLAGGWGIESWERLSERQVSAERLVLGLRLADGIPLEWLERHLGGPSEGQAGIGRYLAAGVMAVRDGRIALTDRGVLLSDTIFAELV